MGAEAEINEIIRQIGGYGKYEILEGVVKSLNEQERTVEVETPNGLLLPEVKLRSVVGGDDGFVCLPAVDSEVVIAQVRGEDDFVLLKTSELKAVVFEIEDMKMVADSTGFQLTTSGVSLHEVLSDLAELLKQFKVTTPSGPSTAVLPDTLTAILQFENKFNTLLNA